MKTDSEKRHNFQVILFSILILGALFSAALCAGAGYLFWSTFVGPPPGKGAKAEAGYKASVPVIAALEKYKLQHDSYPKTLEALVPDYLPDRTGTPEDFPFDYRVTEEGYELTFRYAGPGMNVCTYKPEMGWDCYGYY